MNISDIAEVRSKKGMTQAELAELAGVSRHTVVNIEAGMDARLSIVRKLLDALGLELRVMPVLEKPMEARGYAAKEAISEHITSLFSDEEKAYHDVQKIPSEEKQHRETCGG